MALITVSTIEDPASAGSQEAAAQTQKLKTTLSRVDGLRVVAVEAEAEPGTKSGATSIQQFAMEVVTSPHVFTAVGLVIYEWLKHNLGKSVQLVIEGEKIVIESGSHRHVQELVELLESKIKNRA